jgi:hypothetical protein
MINESLTRWNKSEPFELQTARGQIRNHYVVHIFGYNPDVDSAAEETIWTAGGLYQHLDTPSIMKVSSSSASDTSAGIGARSIYIVGINSTGGEVFETVILNGQTPVNTIHTYSSIQTSSVVSVGSATHNEGNISIGTGTVTGGVPANIYGHILVSENKSLIGHYTIPAGYTGYLISGGMSSGTEGGSAYVIGRLKVRQNDIVYTSALVTFSNGQVNFDFKYPIAIPEGACIQATAKSTANNESVSCNFEIVLIKNEE